MPQTVSTTDLLGSFSSLDSDETVERYISAHTTDTSASDLYKAYLDEKGLTSADIVNRVEGYISKNYFYLLLSGKRANPRRDVVLLLCFAARMDRKAMRRQLEAYHLSPLYPKNARDAVLMSCINRKIYDLAEVNDQLYLHGQEAFQVGKI